MPLFVMEWNFLLIALGKGSHRGVILSKMRSKQSEFYPNAIEIAEWLGEEVAESIASIQCRLQMSSSSAPSQEPSAVAMSRREYPKFQQQNDCAEKFVKVCH